MRKEKTKKKITGLGDERGIQQTERRSSTSRNMKPLEVWTCQRAENLKKKSSKIPKNNYAATMVSAARRQIIGGGAPITKSQRRRPQIGGGAAGARLYMERCPPPSRRPVFFQHILIYIAKIMGLLHGSRVQRKVRYFIYYSHRDIELDCESNIDEFGPKNRREFSNILVNLSKLFGFTF